MNDSTHAAIVIGGVMFLAWCGLGRLVRRDRVRGFELTPEQRAELCRAALASEFRPHGIETPGGSVSCLHCGTPYPAGVLYCDCGGETIDEEEDSSSDVVEWLVAPEMVCVHRTENLWKANLLRSYLESHAIACTIQRGSEATPLELVPLHRPGLFSLLVQPADRDQASGLLAEVELNQAG
ncbi:hypothetical protein GC173_14950 [bacterium]|nr:hypothetical protein [bacterium]